MLKPKSDEKPPSCSQVMAAMLAQQEDEVCAIVASACTATGPMAAVVDDLHEAGEVVGELLRSKPC